MSEAAASEAEALRAEVARLSARVDELLAANGRLVEQRRRATAAAGKYQALSADMGMTLLRRGWALEIVREFGVASRSFHAFVSADMARWIDGGAVGCIPWPSSPFFHEWARDKGYSNVDSQVFVTERAADPAEPR
ncbi:MAG: hypothetical protein AB7P02_29220 [Alphaproteobacteria bacterium]